MSIYDSLNWIQKNRLNLGQHIDEITWLYDKVSEIRPRTMMEIGARHGSSLYILAHACEPGATIISVDLPGGAWGFDVSEHQWFKVIQQLSKEGFNPMMVKGSSQDRTIVETIREQVWEKLDFLFIDGDHKLDAVTQDYENYESMVRDGGLIAFHDINPDDRKFRWGQIQVDKLWEELKQTNCTEQFGDWAGIGILHKGVSCLS